jgi:cell fate (sporulation/competence/biofilm development) regulator YlbF (YheA/YmcA/DUF963 family)
MNVYEEAHDLADAIKQSQEYKQYMEMQKVIDQNPLAAEKIQRLQKMQLDFQAKQMAGEQLPPNFMQEIQQMSQTLMTDPATAQYMQALMRFSLMIADVYKILGEVVNIGNMPQF